MDPADCEHPVWNPDNGECLDCCDMTPPAPYPSNPDRAAVHSVPDAMSLTACGKVPTWAVASTSDRGRVTCTACLAALP